MSAVDLKPKGPAGKVLCPYPTEQAQAFLAWHQGFQEGARQAHAIWQRMYPMGLPK